MFGRVFVQNSRFSIINFIKSLFKVTKMNKLNFHITRKMGIEE